MQDIDELPAELHGHAVTTFMCYDLDVACHVRSALWPGRHVRSLRMPHATRGYIHRAINEYLLTFAGEAGDIVGGYGLPDDIDYTLDLMGAGISALKMYYRYREPEAKVLAEVFPDPILEAAGELAIPIVAHLPRSLPDSTPDVLALASRHPRLRVIVAHAGGGGGQFYQDGLSAAFAALADAPGIVFDTALVWDRPLLTALVEEVGPDRVLFGTDEPLSLIRSVPYQHPRLGSRLYAPEYHWAQDDGAPAAVTSAEPELLHLLQVEAVIAAVSPYGSSALNAVFHDNAAELFGIG